MKQVLVLLIVAGCAFVFTVSLGKTMHGEVNKMLSVEEEKEVEEGTCTGRCGDSDPSTVGCQCSVTCTKNTNCCKDYRTMCWTCSHRCSDGASKGGGAPCQCDPYCGIVGNCCKDYSQMCEVSTEAPPYISDAELLFMSEQLYDLEHNNVAAAITLDMQGLTTMEETDDKAPLPLYAAVLPEAFTGPTVVLFEDLRDNYDKQTGVVETQTPQEGAEVTAFLDAVASTPLMVRLADFLTHKELITDTLRSTLETIWFTNYCRNDNRVKDTSGFEHVFMGELNNGSVGGFHNWVVFYREEQQGNVDYKGYIEYAHLGDAGYVLTSRFTWLSGEKPIGGGFVGSSPEFELGMFTLCYLSRPNGLCPVQTNGLMYSIQTYDHEGLVETAYPIVNKEDVN